MNSTETPGTHHAHSPPVESDLCSLRAPMGLSFGVGISSPVVSAVGTMQGWAGSSMPINAVHPAANLPEWGVRSVALLTSVHEWLKDQACPIWGTQSSLLATSCARWREP